MKKTKEDKKLSSLKGRAATIRKLVDSMPTSVLILQLNSTIKMLEQRGVVIRDWDNKDKIVRCIRTLGGRYYSIANDDIDEASFYNFILAFYENAVEAMRPGAVI